MSAANCEKFTAVIEGGSAFAQLCKNLYPLLTLIVAAISSDVVGPKHRKVMLIPSANNVEASATVRDMVQCRQRAGRPRWVNDRHLHGCKQCDALGNAAQGRSLCHRLHTPAARVRCPAVTPPALQRQKKIKPSTVGYSGDFGYILPPRTPPLRHLCHCDSATRIQRKEAKQETMGVRQTGSQPAL